MWTHCNVGFIFQMNKLLIPKTLFTLHNTLSWISIHPLSNCYATGCGNSRSPISHRCKKICLWFMLRQNCSNGLYLGIKLHSLCISLFFLNSYGRGLLLEENATHDSYWTFLISLLVGWVLVYSNISTIIAVSFFLPTFKLCNSVIPLSQPIPWHNLMKIWWKSLSIFPVRWTACSFKFHCIQELTSSIFW